MLSRQRLPNYPRHGAGDLTAGHQHSVLKVRFLAGVGAAENTACGLLCFLNRVLQENLCMNVGNICGKWVPRQKNSWHQFKKNTMRVWGSVPLSLVQPSFTLAAAGPWRGGAWGVPDSTWGSGPRGSRHSTARRTELLMAPTLFSCCVARLLSNPQSPASNCAASHLLGAKRGSTAPWLPTQALESDRCEFTLPALPPGPWHAPLSVAITVYAAAIT